MRYVQGVFSYYLIILFSGSVLLFPAAAWSAYESRLSDTHIQSSLVKHFPIRKYAAFARITLHEPQVILTRDSKELLLIVPVNANIPDQAQRQGHARLAVKLSYKPGNGGLYLNHPRVIELEMPQISKAMNIDLKAEIATIALNSLPLVQIFKIKESSLNHSLAKSRLKTYSIEDGFINLEFGFD